MVYGLKFARKDYVLNAYIGEPEGTPNGNIVIRVGRQLRSGSGWEQIGNVILEPTEAREFITAMDKLLWKKDGGK